MLELGEKLREVSIDVHDYKAMVELLCIISIYTVRLKSFGW